MGHLPIAHVRSVADRGAAADACASQNTPLLIRELEARRQMLGRSVTDIAERCGIEAAALSRWEQGDDVPRLDAVQRWAAALGLHCVLVPAETEARLGLRVDWHGRKVTVDGKPVRLTPMEWKALERLAHAPGQVVTHQALFHHLYGEERDYRAQSTAIRVLITKLRRLLPLRIEAQWGKGYVLSGLSPSLPEGHPGAHHGRDGASPEASSPQMAVTPRPCNRDPVAPAAITPTAPKLAMTGAMLAGIAAKKVSRVAPPPARQAACRSEELGVIERFLAERGVTRCPDVATIQHSPLPTLVWDKAKRKWVRPTASGREAV